MNKKCRDHHLMWIEGTAKIIIYPIIIDHQNHNLSSIKKHLINPLHHRIPLLHRIKILSEIGGEEGEAFDGEVIEADAVEDGSLNHFTFSFATSGCKLYVRTVEPLLFSFINLLDSKANFHSND